MTHDFAAIFNGFWLKNRIFHAFSAAQYVSKIAKPMYPVGYVNIRLCIHWYQCAQQPERAVRLLYRLFRPISPFLVLGIFLAIFYIWKVMSTFKSASIKISRFSYFLMDLGKLPKAILFQLGQITKSMILFSRFRYWFCEI